MKYYTTSKYIMENLTHFFNNDIERVSLSNIHKILFSTNHETTVVSFSDKKSSELSKKLNKYSGVNFLTLDKSCIHGIGNDANDTNLWGAFLHKRPYYLPNSTIEQKLNSAPKKSFSSDILDEFLATGIFFTNEIFQPINIKSNSVLFIDEGVEELTRKHADEKLYDYNHIFNTILENNTTDTTIYVLNPSTTNYKSHKVVPIVSNVNPNTIFEKFEYIYTVNSITAIYAVISGHKVSCFGSPFYSGWGLTTDLAEENPIRLTKHTKESLFDIVFQEETIYHHPGNSKTLSLLETCDYINKYKEHHLKFHRDVFFIGISHWKRKFMSAYFSSTLNGNHFFATPQEFMNNFNDFPHTTPIIIHWGVRIDPKFKKFCDNNELTISIVEDGFIRSKGLGSNLTIPFSIVYDDLGIYFDARTPSRLEFLLQNYKLTPEQEIKALETFNFFRNANISKYNHLEKQTFDFDTDKKKILVLGQVEDDASIQFGCSYPIDNTALLRRVRHLEPHSFIIYKPHPDIVAKNRDGKVPFGNALAYCDVIISDSDIFSLIDEVDCVHTITSLSGFESLIRGKEVICHGMPFYAGWGLTTNLDIENPAFLRRTQNRTIVEMFYITYILYPIYFNHQKNHLIEMEDLVELILNPTLLKKSDNKFLLFFLNIKRFMKRTFFKKKEISPFNNITRIIPSDQLINKNLLFLQGPIGPFFKHLQQNLTTKFNSNCQQVVFNGGDLIFSFKKRILFLKSKEKFEKFISEIYIQQKIDKIFLLGDCRPVHKIAIAIAHKHNIEVFVFEEGYFRPNFITLEKNGVNANSSETRDSTFYNQLNLFNLQEGNKRNLISPVGKTKGKMSRMATKYYLFMLIFKPLFLSWEHHKTTSLLLYSFYFWRGKLIKKYHTSENDQEISIKIKGELSKKYFLLPLQINSDFQIKEHSQFRDMQEVLETVFNSFSKFSLNDQHLIIKLHPMDIGTSDYSEYIKNLTHKYNIKTDRIHYIIDVNLPNLLAHSLGVIVVNSTVGISALHHNKPTITLGNANYNMSGITHQNGIDTFWTTPVAPIPELFLKYKLYTIKKSQINGSFYV